MREGAVFAHERIPLRTDRPRGTGSLIDNDDDGFGDPVAMTAKRYRPASGHARDIPLRDHTEQALSTYFDSLNGHRPGRLYDLVISRWNAALPGGNDYADGKP